MLIKISELRTVRKDSIYQIAILGDSVRVYLDNGKSYIHSKYASKEEAKLNFDRIFKEVNAKI